MFKRLMERLRRKKPAKEVESPEEPQKKENPFLPQLREILEAVLKLRGLDYGSMRLLLIDTDREPESMLEEDDIKLALDQLSEDLNFLTILTGRPEYFEAYVETMYEETGLLVQLEEKKSDRAYEINTILDFEQFGGFPAPELLNSALYIPIYKKRWEKTDHLDISVPIGYNTVIIKGISRQERFG